MRTKRWLAAAIACTFGVLLLLTGTAQSALAAGDPSPGIAYGCITGSSRTLDDVYTTAQNFSNFITNSTNNGSCPNGFSVGIGKVDPANTNYPDLPSTEPVYGCVESGRTVEDVYEDLSSFQTFLGKNNNACPSGGFIVYIGPSNSMPAQSPIGAEGPAWGCVVGSTRTFQDAYTVQSNYDSWLAASPQDGSCPNGFQATIGYNYNCTLNNLSGNTSATDYASCGGYSDLSVPAGSTQSVQMDMWDSQGCYPGDTCTQRLDANSSSDWQFTADMTNNPAQNDYVISYPDQQTIFAPIANTTNSYEPASYYTSFSGSWIQSDPPIVQNSGWESAYDIWYGGGPGGTPGSGKYGYEIMIWTVNNNDKPAGSQISGLTCSDGSGGPTFNVFVTSTSGVPNTVTLEPTSNLSTSGSLNFVPLFQCLDSNHLINDAAMGEAGTSGWTGTITGLYEMDYGWEVQSTVNVPATFTMEKYTLTAAP